MAMRIHPSLKSLLPIAVISHAHPSVSKGGAEIAAFTLFQGLRDLGYPAIFIAAVPVDARERLHLGADEYPVFYEPERYDHLYQLGDPDVLRQMRGILERTGAKLLNFHHFMNFGINAVRDLALDPRYRTVLTIHEFLAICHNHGQMVTWPNQSLCSAASGISCGACFPDIGWRRLDMRASLLRNGLLAIDHFVSPSQFLVDRFVAWGLPADRISVIENGLARPAPERPAANRSAEKTTWTFGYFGQVTPFKGVDVILNAAEHLAKNPAIAQRIQIRINGNIVGVSDQFRGQLAAVSEKHGFLRFVGPYENSNVLNLMSECDYILMPSVWWENSPVVIQEAFAAGRPLICTGIGGMAEKVQNHVSGLHFRRGDAADLARVIADAADDPLYDTLTGNIPRPYGRAQMALHYLGVFKAAIVKSRLKIRRRPPASLASPNDTPVKIGADVRGENFSSTLQKELVDD